MDSDGQLLARIKAGDREALALLYGRYLPSVWRYVYAQLRGDDQASRDVVSETFLAAVRNLTRGNASVAGVGAWLTGIARHKLADARRFALKQAGMDAAAGAEVRAVGVDPSLALEAADTRWMVARALDRMDDIERTVLEWKYIEALAVREIARRLDRSEKAVEALLYRARNSFRAIYDGMHARPNRDS